MYLTIEQKKLIENIKSKIDKDATMDQILAEFNFKLYSIKKNSGVGGLYLYNDNSICINERYWDDDNEINPWNIFVHEFGHLIHHMSTRFDFYQEYKRRNLVFSQILESEQQASLIGLEIWNWKFPNKKLESIPYVTNRDISWLANYYKPHFKNDLL